MALQFGLFAQIPKSETPTQVIVSSAKASIRSKPAIKARRIRLVPRNAKADVYAFEPHSKWYLVQYRSVRGWIKASQVRRAPAPNCVVDWSLTPEMKGFALKLPLLCDANYPPIKKKLFDDDFVPPKAIRIVFKNDLCDEKGENCYPAVTLGSEIRLSAKWFKEHPDDLGAIVHEMAHVAQSYPGSAEPGWLREGIADYIRYWRGYRNEWSYAHCGQSSPRYDSGYWCTAAFLQFVEKQYDRQIIPRLNRTMRKNEYHDEFFLLNTTKSIEELWTECLEADCRGGTP